MSAVHELTLQPEFFELADDLGKPTAKLGAVADVLYPTFLEKEITINDVIRASNKIEYYKDKISIDKFREIVTKCTPYWESRQKQEFDLTAKERIYLDHKTREIVKSCVEALSNNKNIQDLLHPKGVLIDPISENEQAILLDVEAECPNGKKFIIRLKSKIDNYTIDTETNTIIVNDVKTIGKIVSEIDSNIVKFHYSREFARFWHFSE